MGKGYRRAKITYTLDNFRRDDMEGLVIVARGMTVGEMQSIFRDVDKRAEATSHEILEWEMIRLAGGEIDGQRIKPAILEWNLEDEDGDPVPIAVDALREYDKSFVLAIGSAWMRRVNGIEDPLDEPSTSGEPFPEESIPMEVS